MGFYICTVCGDPVSGTMIGDGNGGGQRFAHAACYRLRDLLWEALPWAPPSVKDRVLQQAIRYNLKVVAP